jgi:hypothetical protein
MNVHSQSAAPVMTMNGMMETSLALSARPDTNVTKVGFEFLFFCGFLFFFCFFFCYSCFLFYDVRDGGDIYYCMMDDEDDDRFFCWQIIAGSPRVAGDEEEEGVDDLENEFNLADANKQEEQHELHGHMSYSDTYDRDLPEHMVHAPTQPQYPLLTNGQVVCMIHPSIHHLEQASTTVGAALLDWICNPQCFGDSVHWTGNFVVVVGWVILIL